MQKTAKADEPRRIARQTKATANTGTSSDAQDGQGVGQVQT